MTAAVVSLSGHIDRRVVAATVTFYVDTIGDVELLRTVTADQAGVPVELWAAHCPVCDTVLVEDADQVDAARAAELHHCER